MIAAAVIQKSSSRSGRKGHHADREAQKGARTLVNTSPPLRSATFRRGGQYEPTILPGTRGIASPGPARETAFLDVAFPRAIRSRCWRVARPLRRNRWAGGCDRGLCEASGCSGTPVSHDRMNRTHPSQELSGNRLAGCCAGALGDRTTTPFPRVQQVDLVYGRREVRSVMRPSRSVTSTWDPLIGTGVLTTVTPILYLQRTFPVARRAHKPGRFWCRRKPSRPSRPAWTGRCRSHIRSSYSRSLRVGPRQWRAPRHYRWCSARTPACRLSICPRFHARRTGSCATAARRCSHPEPSDIGPAPRRNTLPAAATGQHAAGE